MNSDNTPQYHPMYGNYECIRHLIWLVSYWVSKWVRYWVNDWFSHYVRKSINSPVYLINYSTYTDPCINQSFINCHLMTALGVCTREPYIHKYISMFNIRIWAYLSLVVYTLKHPSLLTWILYKYMWSHLLTYLYTSLAEW